MRTIRAVSMLLIAQVILAQEIDVQELFKKIEERNAALKNLKAHAFVLIYEPSAKIFNIVGDVTYSKDEFLSFEALVKAPVIGSAIINYVYLKDKWACKFTSTLLNPPLKISLAAKGQEANSWTEFFSIFAHWTLLDLNLTPSKVFKDKQLQIEKAKKNGKEYALLKYTITLFDLSPVRVTYYLNLKELFFEKVISEELIAQVEKFNNVNNIPLPQSVMINTNDRLLAKIIFKSFQTNLDKIEQPYWLSDTNLPEITKETSQELKSKIEEAPQNIKLILQYLTTRLLETQDFFGNLNALNDFSKEYKSMQSELEEIETDSVLVNDMELVSVIGEGKLKECEEKLKQINYNSPHAIYLFALKLVDKKKDPSQSLEKIKQDSIIKETILSEYKISQVKTLQELQDVLEGKTFEDKLFLCDRIEPGYMSGSESFPIKSVLSKKLVEEMEKKAEDDFIKLLLARYFARKKGNEKASRYYLQLSDKLFNFVQSEIVDFAKRGGTTKLLERVVKITKDIELLARYAFENTKSPEIDAIIKELVKSFKPEQYLSSECKNYLIQLAKKLSTEGRRDLSIQLFFAMTKLRFWFDENIIINLVEMVAQPLEKYMLCEVILDKLNEYEPRYDWEKERVSRRIQEVNEVKKALGITQQHFIDYLVNQPSEEVEQDVKEKVQALIKELDSDKPGERERATQELIKMGKKIVHLLKEHLNSPSLEVQVRVKNILYKIGYDELRQQILQENK